MSEKLTNDNLDDLFRNSIDNMETEPSENFWVNASESALFKSTQAGKRSVTRWRMIAAALLVMLLGISAYVVYMQKQLSVINGRLIAVESKSNSNAIMQHTTLPHDETNTVNDIVTNNTGGDNSAMASSGPSSSAIKTSRKALTASNNSVYSASSNSVKTTDNLLVTDNAVRNQTHKQYVNNSKNYTNSSVNSNDLNISVVTNKAVANENAPIEVQSIAAAGNNSLIPLNNGIEGIAGSIEPVQNYVRPADDKKRFLSRLSMSIFYEPYISDELLENESTDIITYNNVSANEEEVHPFSLGLKASYDISKHLSAITGCTYYNFNASVSPTTIYAQKQPDGEVAYFFQTSAGIVQCPYTNNAKAGDGMVISGEEKVSYISIPLQLKYNFNPVNRLNVYVTAGMQVNIVAMRSMDMHWQDFKWDEGNITEGIDNRKKLYESYYIAPGISYRIIKGISIYFEPSLQGSPVLSANSKGTPYVGIGGGITYHL